VLAIIGGTGLSSLPEFEQKGVVAILTPYSKDPVELTQVIINSRAVVFLPRHGGQHTVPPHKVNYRAHIWALKQAGVTQILGINAVGGISEQMAPANFCVPEQIIDYTWGREATFFDEELTEITHVDFTEPFCEVLRRELLASAVTVNLALDNKATVIDGGVYGCTQGPRLETAAEVKRLERDGCDLVGMTAMPEVALARELGIDYVMLALSVNWAAGVGVGKITLEEIHGIVGEGMIFVHGIIKVFAAGPQIDS
jgi:5'-deoxy-5'-methylthioadenosine phosphorylase